jgi:hypothetical protein
MMCAFLLGSLFLIVGIGLFTLGVDSSMVFVGEKIGSEITRTRKIPLIAFSCFLIGTIVTIAEPDLRVLAEQVGAVPDMVLILAVAVGVGLFLLTAFLRILFQIPMRLLLLILYLGAFALALSPLIPDDFIPMAFDSGGVTTGPITVPFILALGIGLASMRGDKTSQEDTFGLVALSSIGPILTVLLLGVIYGGGDAALDLGEEAEVVAGLNTKGVFNGFVSALPEYVVEVASALIPILVICLVYNFFLLKINPRKMKQVFAGFGITFIGLILFLTGVNVGFMPVADIIGESLGGSPENKWFLIPLGAFLGYFIVEAEPAVHVLKKQVNEVTSGSISEGAIGTALSIGVSLSVALAMVRVITGISIFWFLIPGYAFALIVMFFVPPLYTSVAFDSGGVASGPMTATFLLPLALGACKGLGGNAALDAFGIVSFVAMTPLIAIQLLGLVSTKKASATLKYSIEDLDTIISV